MPLIVLAVVALVAVVAVAAHGRPLGSGAGHGGLSTTFWDFTVTTVVILAALIGLGMIGLLTIGAPRRQRWTPPSHKRSLKAIFGFSLAVSIAFVIRQFIHFRFRVSSGQSQKPPAIKGFGGHGHSGPLHAAHHASVHFRWDEVAVAVLLSLIASSVIYAVNRRRGPLRRPERTGPEVLAAALDESLDDLRADPDLRRAIIAAYARMERALGAAGMPRRPAEAPLEYLERALLELDTSGTAVRRLTDLFEWARFSHHEPEPRMRDEAIDALEAVRDELRDVPAPVYA